MLLLSSADFFQISLFFSKNSFRSTIRVSNDYDPDQDRHLVGLDLGPKCEKVISRRQRSWLARKELWDFQVKFQTINPLFAGNL